MRRVSSRGPGNSQYVGLHVTHGVKPFSVDEGTHLSTCCFGSRDRNEITDVVCTFRSTYKHMNSNYYMVLLILL